MAGPHELDTIRGHLGRGRRIVFKYSNLEPCPIACRLVINETLIKGLGKELDPADSVDCIGFEWL